MGVVVGTAVGEGALVGRGVMVGFVVVGRGGGFVAVGAAVVVIARLAVISAVMIGSISVVWYS
jgi:hypothetical protein